MGLEEGEKVEGWIEGDMDGHTDRRKGMDTHADR